MSRTVGASLVVFLSLSVGPPAASQETAEQAVQALVTGSQPKDHLEEAEHSIEAAASQEPENVRWQFGKALLLRARGERVPARDLMAKVVAREPDDADHQAYFGVTIFEAIDEVGMFSKMSWGVKGKAALEKAVLLDPNHVLARQGLIEFYLEAPAIAGGSTAKAEEQAKALLAIQGGRGEFQGHLALARVAGERKDWAEMGRQYTLAETAQGDGASATTAMTLHVLALLRDAEDPKGALAVSERWAKSAKPDDTTPVFFMGEAYRKLGNCKAAVERYAKVLAAKPDAVNTRFGIAQCYEKLGESAQAAAHYEGFVRRFPKDARAGEATSAARRLRKAG